MADEAGRPQDQGRRHRRGGNPSPETATLLGEYQAAMRSELRALLDDVRGAVPDPGLLDEPDKPRPPVRPALKERIPMWDLAIKLGRELGTEVDVSSPGDASPGPVARGPRRRKVDFG